MNGCWPYILDEETETQGGYSSCQDLNPDMMGFPNHIRLQGPIILVPSLHIEFIVFSSVTSANLQAIVTGREKQLSPRV